MPEEDKPKKVVFLDPARRHEEVALASNAECVELAEEMLEMCRSDGVEELIIVARTADRRVEYRWNMIERQSLIWLLESAKFTVFQRIFDENNDQAG